MMTAQYDGMSRKDILFVFPCHTGGKRPRSWSVQIEGLTTELPTVRKSFQFSHIYPAVARCCITSPAVNLTQYGHTMRA
jgi:hypothetical protein